MTFEVGRIYLWKNFPTPRHGEIKNNWFLFLGQTSYGAPQLFLFFQRTTSQVQKYLPGNERSNSNHLKLSVKNTPELELETDSILDFTEPIYNILPEKIAEHSDNIQPKGKIKEHILKDIFNRIMKNPAIPQNIKKDIQNSFNLAGISGLKTAKSKKSKFFN
jgi:hypothetical protein